MTRPGWPGCAGYRRLTRALGGRVMVRQVELAPRGAPPVRAPREGPPVDLCFGERDRYAQYPTMTFIGDADGNQTGAVEQTATVTNALIAGIEVEVGSFVQRALAPYRKPRIELFGGTADLCRRERDLRAEQLHQNIRHLAGGDALHIHFGERKIERLLGARAFFEGAGIETAAAHLKNIESQFADAGHDGLGLEAVGIIDSFGGTFMRPAIHTLRPFNLARFVDQDAQGFASTIETVGQQRRKSGVKGIVFYALCHAVDSFVRGKMLRRNRLPDCQPGMCRAPA